MESSQVGGMLLGVLSGSAIPEALRGVGFVKTLSSASRLLRWLACSQMPEVYAELSQDSSVTWPEASTMAHLWQRCEAKCTRAWADWVLEKPVDHVSAHFDGLRVTRPANAEDPSASAAYLRSSAEAIAARTGFVLSVHIKTHHTLVQMLLNSPERAPGWPCLARNAGSVLGALCCTPSTPLPCSA